MRARTVGAVLGWVALALFLVQCRGTAYDPVFPESASFKVHHLGTYSTKLAGEEEKEQQGTIFETRLSFRMEKHAAGYALQRRLDTMVARGYHKLSMPHELEKKVNLDMELDSLRIPVRIRGYDTLAKVLGRLNQKEEFRKQLLQSSDTSAFAAYARDWWRMAALLPRGQEFKMGQKLSVEAVNGTLETLKLDSARFDAINYRGPPRGEKRACLEYTLHYHRADSLPLLVEQFFFSGIQFRKYRKYSWKPGRVQGFLQFSVERATGLPCFHARTEIGDITLEYKEDKAEVPIQLFRYEEDIYEL